jgi:citrate synthase
MSNVAKLEIDGKVLELPIKTSSLGENGIDISSLYKQTGYFTFDPGFISTAACESSITYIDGNTGILRHRGYDIQDLADKVEFVDLVYLLLYEELPNPIKKGIFDQKLVSLMNLPEGVKNLVRNFDKNAHPMAIMMSGLSYLSSIYEVDYNPNSLESVDSHCLNSIAKSLTLGAFIYRYISDQKEVKSSSDFSFIENFVRMMFGEGVRNEDMELLKLVFNKILILHADHEQNASTSTARVVASTNSNVLASVVAGFAALWGPLHGGANEEVINMLEEIKTKDRIPEFIERAKDKNDPFRLMGFGHRVYKSYDPRAAVLKSSCDQILEKYSTQHPEVLELLDIAKELEKIALNDDYFKARNLFPNVDFYSGLIYKSMNIPSRFYTVIFGVSRTAGWVAQIKESLMSGDRKISRPRQIYTGEKKCRLA